MERATKILVVIWTGMALAMEIWLLRGAWPGLPYVAPAGFAAVAALAAWNRRSVGIVLGLIYVFPVLVYVHLGNFYSQYSAVWMSLLLGAIFPTSIRTSWQVPTRWRAALVGWALIVIIGASIVVAREIDFTPALFHVTTISNTAGGGWPSFIIMWVLHVAVVLLLGILWFDWLLGLSDRAFHAAVATPMAVSCLGLMLTAVYQLFGSVSFLNPTVFARLMRATGTVFDANVCGTVAALWIGGSVLWAERLGRWRPFVSTGGILLGWLAVWASGSRTAFAAAIIVTVFSIVVVYPMRARSWFRALIPVAITAGGAVSIGFILANAELQVIGPIARLRGTLPKLSIESMKSAINEDLWNRNGYGAAASAMVRQYPLFGVGVGSFQSILPEFNVHAGRVLPPDNAQNWYRHQLAELGIVGSTAWLMWLGGFGMFVLSWRQKASPIAWCARGILLAFAAISFVGMPGQEAIVAITFWTMASWYVRLAGAPPAAPMKPTTCALIIVVLAAYGAGTAHAGTTRLRVPVRAQRVGWPYSYGFHSAVSEGRVSDGRWTERRAVAVVEASSRWIALTISVDHRAVGPAETAASLAHAPTRPVDVWIWLNGQLILLKHLTTTAPVTEYVRVPDGEHWVMLETRVSRVLRPIEFGIPDNREFGLLTKWSFVDGPAANHPR